MWDDPSPIQQEIAIKIARLCVTNDGFSPGDNDFGRVASHYGTKMIEWFNLPRLPLSITGKPRYDVRGVLLEDI
jgi:hypothetical protein